MAEIQVEYTVVELSGSERSFPYLRRFVATEGFWRVSAEKIDRSIDRSAEREGRRADDRRPTRQGRASRRREPTFARDRFSSRGTVWTPGTEKVTCARGSTREEIGEGGKIGDRQARDRNVRRTGGIGKLGERGRANGRPLNERIFVISTTQFWRSSGICPRKGETRRDPLAARSG